MLAAFSPWLRNPALHYTLTQAKGAADSAAAAATVSGMELGGLAGSIFAGWLSDAFIKRAHHGEGHVGQRVKLVMVRRMNEEGGGEYDRREGSYVGQRMKLAMVQRSNQKKRG